MSGEMAIFNPHQESDTRNEQIAALQADVRRLTREVTAANTDAEQAHRDTARALSALRQQLSPLYRALQSVFGELDAVGVDESAPQQINNANPHTAAIWQSWKSKFPGKPAAIIDALVIHREMNQQQIAIAIGSSRNNIPAMIYKLNKAGLIRKNGNMYSLKEL